MKESQEEKRSEPKSEEKQEETTAKVVDPKTRFVNAVEEFLDYLPWMLIILPNLVIFNEFLFENNIVLLIIIFLYYYINFHI